MKGKESFKRLSIEEMELKKKQQELSKLHEKARIKTEDKVIKACEELAHEMVEQGFHEDSFEIHPEGVFEKGKYVVRLFVVQNAKELEFEIVN